MLIHRTIDDFTLDRYEIALGGTLRPNNRPDPYQVNKGITRVYYFVRNASGDLVADVTDERDIKRLLAIREGYAPYGEEASAQARELFRWREAAQPRQAPKATSVVDNAPNLPDDPSQPPVVDEDLDDEDDDPDDSGLDDDQDDELDGVNDSGTTKPPAALGELPSVPPLTADGAEWMAYVTALPGISPLIPGLSKEKNQEQQKQLAAQLRTYAMENYGAELPANKGTMVLAKEIGKLQIAAEAG